MLDRHLCVLREVEGRPIYPLLGIPVGLALSTAAGLRIFIPLLITSLAARSGYLTLTPSMTWLASDAALVAFVTAAVIEVGAYYMPWLDNVADAIAMPAAITAGIIEMAAVTPDLPPLLRWTVAIIAGGGVAGFAQLATTLLRFKSSTLTAGTGNPFLATAELVGSLAIAVLAVLAPLVAAVFVLILLVVLARRVIRRRRARRAGLAAR
jgi:uncharacterized protein DUF4126